MARKKKKKRRSRVPKSVIKRIKKYLNGYRLVHGYVLVKRKRK